MVRCFVILMWPLKDFKSRASSDSNELPCEIQYLQETQLSQRGRSTLQVVVNFTKLLKVMRNDTVEWGKFLSVFHCNYVSNVYRF